MRTVRRGLYLSVTDAELRSFAETALRLLVGDAVGPLTRHAETRASDLGDDITTYRLGSERVGLAVREAYYTHDSGGFNNLPNGSLLAFVAYGLPDGLALDVRREVDACDLARVVVVCTGPEVAAEAVDEAYQRELARMSGAEIAALDALRRVANLPETNGFDVPARALGWELAKPPNVERLVAARDALAPVATDGARQFWLGALKVKLGDLEGGAEALMAAHGAMPESQAIAMTAVPVLLDLGRNREVIGLLSPFARNTACSELLALAWFRDGHPTDALAALGGRRGVTRARLLDATGDRDGAVRELRHAFLDSPEQARLFRDGAASKLGAMIDEDWILAMWGEPRVADMLKADFGRDIRGYNALLAVEDVPPFTRDMDATAEVDPSAVDIAARTKADQAKLARAFELLRTLSRDRAPVAGVQLRLALLCMMMGRRDDARRLFEHAYRSWPANAAASHGLHYLALAPQIDVEGVTFAASPVANTEAFVVVARTSDHVDWEQRISVQILPLFARLALEADPGRIVFELEGEHPRGGERIIERVFFDRRTGTELGRESLAG
jgi:tetratricopeptide (TPR) repeat protein